MANRFSLVLALAAACVCASALRCQNEEDAGYWCDSSFNAQYYFVCSPDPPVTAVWMPCPSGTVCSPQGKVVDGSPCKTQTTEARCPSGEGAFCLKDATHNFSNFYVCNSTFQGWLSCQAGMSCVANVSGSGNPCAVQVAADLPAFNGEVCAAQVCGNSVCEVGENCDNCEEDCCACNTEVCELPDCRCPDLRIPGSICVTDTPQFIVFTLDDFLDADVWPNVQQILANAPTDAAGCSLKLTGFFHGGTQNYNLMNYIVEHGGELGDHTANHNTNTQTDYDTWVQQLEAGRSCTNYLAQTPDDVVGSRAPFLQWNAAMFAALSDLGFVYDSSVTSNYEIMSGWPWPFLVRDEVPRIGFPSDLEPLDFSVDVWEFPLYAPLNPDTNESEEPMDLPDTDMTNEELLASYEHSFDVHYATNRAPYGVFWHAFTIDQGRVDMILEFLNYATSFPNVFYATEEEVIEWVQNPVTAQRFLHEGGFDCSDNAYPAEFDGTTCPDGADGHFCAYPQATWLGLNLTTCAACLANYDVGQECPSA
eukprot:TRINITY_DN4430_c0_g1_i6.p1 TRINITY_DN4430_c0_g1~~TRINITY_DN4430_c0_g1_i6.p1  ORF type:complete len:535 (+),score=149.40 TRINITY_DN4430_c0_g1_i6:79-1683(+)